MHVHPTRTNGKDNKLKIVQSRSKLLDHPVYRDKQYRIYISLSKRQQFYHICWRTNTLSLIFCNFDALSFGIFPIGLLKSCPDIWKKIVKLFVYSKHRGSLVGRVSTAFWELSHPKTQQFYHLPVNNIGLATKWLRILSLDGIDKIRNHLVANAIYYPLLSATAIYIFEIFADLLSRNCSDIQKKIAECFSFKFWQNCEN